VGFSTIQNEEGAVIGAKVDLEKATEFLIEKLNLDGDTKWKIGADGRPNGKHSETAVYLSSLSVGKEQYQSPSNVYPIALVQGKPSFHTYLNQLA
jgi:hypothetical protein